MTGDKFGGDAVLVVNEELRFPLFWDMSGLVFFDAGRYLGLRSRPGDRRRPRPPAAPVGVIRLDLARPLDRRPGDPSFKLYVGLGNAF